MRQFHNFNLRTTWIWICISNIVLSLRIHCDFDLKVKDPGPAGVRGREQIDSVKRGEKWIEVKNQLWSCNECVVQRRFALCPICTQLQFGASTQMMYKDTMDTGFHYIEDWIYYRMNGNTYDVQIDRVGSWIHRCWCGALRYDDGKQFLNCRSRSS